MKCRRRTGPRWRLGFSRISPWSREWRGSRYTAPPWKVLRRWGSVDSGRLKPSWNCIRKIGTAAGRQVFKRTKILQLLCGDFHWLFFKKRLLNWAVGNLFWSTSSGKNMLDLRQPVLNRWHDVSTAKKHSRHLFWVAATHTGWRFYGPVCLASRQGCVYPYLSINTSMY